jgi:hypothetical protein
MLASCLLESSFQLGRCRSLRMRLATSTAVLAFGRNDPFRVSSRESPRSSLLRRTRMRKLSQPCRLCRNVMGVLR